MKFASITVTKIKRDRTKISIFFVFLLNPTFSIFLLTILNIVLQPNCEAMLKISSKIRKMKERTDIGPIS